MAILTTNMKYNMSKNIGILLLSVCASESALAIDLIKHHLGKDRSFLQIADGWDDTYVTA
jgi:hypothetical protein